MKKISDFNNATEKYPVVYAGSATRPEYVDMPTTLQQQEGVAPMDTLPAQWWNAMWKLATKDINAFRDYVGDAITEINNLLTEFGITLDDADTVQLYDFFHDSYVQNYLKGIFVRKSGDTIDGDLHIKGDLSVDGIGEEIISTELKVGANTITLRNDNPSALGATELAGVVTENYDGSNHNNIIAINKDGVARVGDIDIATRILYSNDGTNFYTDEDLTTPATIGATEEVRDTGNQTSGGVEIYEGITYSNDDTQAIATREENPTDGAFMKWDATQQMLVSASASAQFEIAWPIGVVYTQYPGQKDPNTLWGQYSTWEELNYGGAFFRADGGNAETFEKSLNISSMSGTSITFAFAHGLAIGSVIYDSVNNEGRVVTGVTNSTTVTIDSAFTDSTITSVLIGQPDQNKSHSHSTNSISKTTVSTGEVSTGNMSANSSGGIRSADGGHPLDSNAVSGCIGGYTSATGIPSGRNAISTTTTSSSTTNGNTINVQHTHRYDHSHNISHTHGTDSNGGTEARTNNFTKKLWRRIA